MNTNKTAVMLLAYNEERNIGGILSGLGNNYDVYVIDDGSTDHTAEIAAEYGCRVVTHCTNVGHGVAVGTALRLAVLDGHDYLVKMDADGQHLASDVPRFVNALDETGVDCVIGSRVLGEDYDGAPLFRRKFLPAYTWAINMATGYRLTDSMCGFRAFRVDFLSRNQHLLDELVEPQYYSAEMLIKFAKAGMTVTEIPIKLEKRTFGRSYKGFVKYGVGVAWAIIHSWVGGKK